MDYAAVVCQPPLWSFACGAYFAGDLQPLGNLGHHECVILRRQFFCGKETFHLITPKSLWIDKIVCV